VSDGSKELWYKKLYALAVDGKLSINELYKEFKLKIAEDCNSPCEVKKVSYYFYNHEYRWGEDLNGLYYKANEVDNKIEKLEQENQKLREALIDIVKSAKFVAQEISHNGDKVGKAIKLHKELIETLSKETKLEEVE
jgi:predicted  nucleic acid-binding Zn-ribbon protein